MIIALTGDKGAGKDTFADILVRKHNFTKVSFADPIHEQCKSLLQLNSQLDYDNVKRTTLKWVGDGAEGVIDGRHLIREIGMLMLSYDKSQFVNYVLQQFKSIPGNVVVSDLRFDHEMMMLKSRNAIIVKILGNVKPEDNHITERGFDSVVCDYTINNKQQDIDNLKSEAYNLIQTLC
jgi:hypothetical protein